MWITVIAVAVTVLLFWQKISLPEINKKTTRSYSIIIPARNEEKNLKKLLPSILTTKSSLREVIVVDDESEDRTRETAVEYGAKVISNPPLPEGWIGKSWACYNGAKEARGRKLIFLDADTWLSPNGSERMINYLESKGKDTLVTVHPYHYMQSFWEKLSAVFHMVVFASSGTTSIFKNKAGTQGGFGPCLLIDSDTYWHLQGHYAIRSEIVEHLALARRAEKKGVKTFAFSGKDVLNMRMYEANLRAVIEGWSKSFASGAKTASPWMTVAAVLWITAVVSFLINIPNIGWWSAAGYVILSFWLYRTLKEMGNFNVYDALLFPLHFLFFVLLFVYSLLKTFLFKQSSWKGRNIAGKK
ncbi:glycosyltransferase [Halobacillus sp. A1]|uniref:glycosyltransferase family 2 protein n=1 Tax=Halobacillus sp. A1 TaxID=2880262 RepID=UPI0020A67BF5|nr:glycosyltransferase family 2 protein [Halobacillus sp. A1]MCP3030793.1 glycosyltransferase [Halobacillus sp. A1]